jgi:diadenosine tetraphosphate (Ap4A) HIT family hydrolase
VAVHDGARPLVTSQLIERGIEAARATGAAVPAIALADTVKEAGADGIVLRTLDRSRLWGAQTPQVFRYELLVRAHREITLDATDDAAMVETLHEKVGLFEGDRRNLKVTTAEDLNYMRWALSGRVGEHTSGSGPASSGNCPFCDYQDRGSVVYEDDQVFAVIDRQPINRYHLLVIPRPHYSSLIALPDELLARVMVVVRDLSSALRRVARPDAVTHMSDDDVAGIGFNLVEHFKFHVIPRYKNDAVKIQWNRGPMPDSDQRGKVAQQVRDAIAGREFNDGPP